LLQPGGLSMVAPGCHPADAQAGADVLGKRRAQQHAAVGVIGLAGEGPLVTEIDLADTSFSISGTSARLRISTNSFFFSSGIMLPSGLLKFEITITALIGLCSRANDSASMLIPSRGCVGISSARRPWTSRAWSVPKYIGDSVATISPGRHTACRPISMASMPPEVIRMSSGDKLQPERAARCAIWVRNDSRPVETDTDGPLGPRRE